MPTPRIVVRETCGAYWHQSQQLRFRDQFAVKDQSQLRERRETIIFSFLNQLLANNWKKRIRSTYGRAKRMQNRLREATLNQNLNQSSDSSQSRDVTQIAQFL
jgi:hypothetical protein